jgi:hypothetical protein
MVANPSITALSASGKKQPASPSVTAPRMPSGAAQNKMVAAVKPPVG